MRKVFVRTLLNQHLEKAKVHIYTYKMCKYKAKSEEELKPEKIVLRGIKSYEIIDGQEAKEMEKEFTNKNEIDDLHEYLIINHLDGTSTTYKNSYVDLFII